jgi:hypothetical protein
VRPPGFGPGSTAWKADVLDQTRLRSPANRPKLFSGEIINSLLKLKGLGKAESTLELVSYKLRYLAKNVNLNDPELIARFITNLTPSHFMLRKKRKVERLLLLAAKAARKCTDEILW